MPKQSPYPISILLWAIPFLCTAQSDRQPTPPKHEVGLSLVSISYKFGHDTPIGNHVYLFNAIRYKRNLGNHAFRLGAEYKHTDSDVEGDVSGESRFLEGKFNLG